MSTIKIAAALSLVGAMSLTSIAPANSAPVTPLSIAAKPGDQIEQVRWGGWHGGWGHGWRGGGWRGGGWGWGVGALAAGALIGGALAAATAPYYGGYYDPYAYGYGYPSYAYSGYGYGYPSYAYSGYYPAYSYYRPYRAYRPLGAYASYRPFVRPYYRRHLYRHW
jgi:hypothetical protein